MGYIFWEKHGTLRSHTHTQTWVVYWINRQQQTGIDGADVGRLRKRETKRHPNVGFWLRVVSLRPSNPLGYPLVN